MISAAEALFAALLVLFPNGDGKGTIYAVPKEGDYQITYIDTVRYMVPDQPPMIEAHVTKVNSLSGKIAQFAFTSKPELYGVSLPEPYTSNFSGEPITIKEAYQKAYHAVEKYQSLDKRGVLQIILRKDYYEIIFDLFSTSGPGVREDSFAYVVHVNLKGDILKIIGPR